MRLVCDFYGWFSIDVKDVNLVDVETGDTKTAKEWLEKRGNIDGLILESFREAEALALDGGFETLDLSLEEKNA